MYSQVDAHKIAMDHIPNGKVQAVIEYNDRYILQIFTDDPEEGQMDPFYSIDPITGEFRDFSVLTDGDMGDIFDLIAQSKARQSLN